MDYEPGTKECYALIYCKEEISKMNELLSKIENTEQVCKQLCSILKELEEMHESIIYKNRIH